MPLGLSRDKRRAGAAAKRDPRLIIFAVAMVAIEAAGLWLRTSRIAGNVVVRCRAGHLFTTIWVPGASLKALRFGWWRFQRCPVGAHWSLVTPVRESDLSEDQLRLAHEHKDLRIP